MKEARIDVILASMSQALLVYLPEKATDPREFFHENADRKEHIGRCFLPILCV